MKNIHRVAAILSFLLLAAFVVITIVTELFLAKQAVGIVKRAIIYGLVPFVMLVAVTAACGFKLAFDRRHPLIMVKHRRVAVIVLNGLLVLLPAGLYLGVKASTGEFDTLFYIVQTIELIVGAATLIMIGLNIRDGMRLPSRD